jgi:hypothetical protein
LRQLIEHDPHEQPPGVEIHGPIDDQEQSPLGGVVQRCNPVGQRKSPSPP